MRIHGHSLRFIVGAQLRGLYARWWAFRRARKPRPWQDQYGAGPR